MCDMIYDMINKFNSINIDPLAGGIRGALEVCYYTFDIDIGMNPSFALGLRPRISAHRPSGVHARQSPGYAAVCW